MGKPVQITTPNATSFPHLAQACTNGCMVWLGGQVGMNLEGTEVLDGMKAQVDQAFSNLDAVLEAAGSSPRNVISMNILLSKDLSDEDRAVFAAKWDAWTNQPVMEGYKPARACWDAILQPGFLLEITNVVAMKC